MGKDESEMVALIYFQYTQMFSPPFIVELLLWPLQTIEYGLLYAVASTSAPAAA